MTIFYDIIMRRHVLVEDPGIMKEGSMGFDGITKNLEQFKPGFERAKRSGDALR